MIDWSALNQPIIGWLVAGIALLAAFIALVGPYARRYAEAWLLRTTERINASLPDNLSTFIQSAALLAARAAEQMGLAGVIENEGKVKLKQAEVFAEKWLAAQGFNVELDVIRAAIEHVIWEGGHKKPSIVALPPPAEPAEVPKTT